MQHKGTRTLLTERLRLRRYCMADAEAIFRNWTCDPEAARFWSWQPHEDVAVTKKLLAQWIDAYDASDYYHWVIADRMTDEPIGYIYLDDIDDAQSSATVHYLLSRRLWNRGLMTEACRRVMDLAFADMGFRIIRSWHHEANPASGRVLQKCGMHRSGEEYRTGSKPQMCGKYILYEIVQQ